MSTIAEKIKEQRQTPYQEIAEKFNTNVNYIGAIARGERIPTRGKGLKIKNYLNELISDK